jgi:hypothetical protein
MHTATLLGYVSVNTHYQLVCANASRRTILTPEHNTVAAVAAAKAMYTLI